jgi:hypothetical protein
MQANMGIQNLYFNQKNGIARGNIDKGNRKTQLMTPNGITPIAGLKPKEERSESPSSAGAAIDKNWIKAKDQDS